jgi:hypothetical protein
VIGWRVLVATVTASLLLLVLAAQSELGADSQRAKEARVPGVIDFGQEGKAGVLSAPTTAQVGKNFELNVTTFGGGCDRRGETSVVFLKTGAAVMVYDITAATDPQVICPAVVKRIPHSVKLRFEKPGEALIQSWGRRIASDAPLFGVPSVIEHRLTVK